MPTQRKRASCPGEELRPAGRPLRGTAVTRTAGGSLAAVGACPPCRGSTTREAPRTAGRPRAPSWPGTRPGEEALARGTTRRSGASSASPSPPAGGSELPRTTPTNSESGRRLLGRELLRDRCALQLKQIGKWMDGWDCSTMTSSMTSLQGCHENAFSRPQRITLSPNPKRKDYSEVQCNPVSRQAFTVVHF